MLTSPKHREALARLQEQLGDVLAAYVEDCGAARNAATHVGQTLALRTVDELAKRADMLALYVKTESPELMEGWEIAP
ncbi:hypothetical protein [Corynebacterium aquilae]|uniref:Uncharacterized protein n=1 Tax=Corynebacterium aquilae DSM 44791 TaxID=1431546 RepID=A0A1L7CHM3_9CORY|nr:hypothetical protein [Corynebacterium aquilae]APT85338.1 hypothetical protein CAQU_10025 [Corynebacterium aquilae DSM 44791]